MNLCFFIGKIVSNIEFDFMMENKKYSISRFKLQLEDGNVIKIKGYNEIADYCYCKLKENKYLLIEGKINTDGYIQIISLEIL